MTMGSERLPLKRKLAILFLILFCISGEYLFPCSIASWRNNVAPTLVGTAHASLRTLPREKLEVVNESKFALRLDKLIRRKKVRDVAHPS